MDQQGQPVQHRRLEKGQEERTQVDEARTIQGYVENRRITKDPRSRLAHQSKLPQQFCQHQHLLR
jgi:hypothetical protein